MVTSRRQVDLPAVADGIPVRENFLSFSQPRLSDEEINSVVETLKSGWLTTASKTRDFESLFADYVGTAHAVGLNSCTAGLFLSLKILDIGPGDEVITTPLTFAASVNVIEHTGAKPVFADIDPVTWCIDPQEVEAKITKSTRAIIPVHLFGYPCD
ncbi:MAG: DegT/DnrJ/EryC1/StrS aminotransferase family protein, partial [bacterium]|nr:DegT/DnrJ/EryC1/StrS aminotransferase family protein [bacterium]